MKQTLEKALATARPEQKNTGDWESLDAFLHYYLDEAKYQDAAIRRLTALSTRPANASQLAGSWDSIPFLIGILYRAEVDGHRPLRIIGMTQEQEQSFQHMCTTIRTAINTYTSGGSGSRSTPTKALYDQIRAIGF